MHCVDELPTLQRCGIQTRKSLIYAAKSIDLHKWLFWSIIMGCIAFCQCIFLFWQETRISYQKFHAQNAQLKGIAGMSSNHFAESWIARRTICLCVHHGQYGLWPKLCHSPDAVLIVIWMPWCVTGSWISHTHTHIRTHMHMRMRTRTHMRTSRSCHWAEPCANTPLIEPKLSVREWNFAFVTNRWKRCQISNA